MIPFRKGLFGTLSAAVAVLVAFGSAEAAEKLRISLDTNPSHVRNKGVELFVEALKRRVGDRMEIEVYPSAQLYRDRDVGRALRQGSVEMAVPGTWVLDGLVPAMAMTSLPAFYGIDEEATLTLMDGELGKRINERTEERMRVKVLGPWMNLGFSHFYSVSRPLRSHEDLRGLKIRISGGTSNAERVSGLGGTPNLIPWPDVPLALSSGVVDAISSTHESVASAKLWESGVRYAFEDNQWFGQYVPLVSQRFWNGLDGDLKTAMTESWAETIPQARAMAAEAQAHARELVIANGVEVVTAEEKALREQRARLLETQDRIVKEMNIDVDLVDLAMQEIDRLGIVK
ncbi:TRAP transporter substrate-binding protein DctP [Skermanella mucosa]|uniref:TRAP transporter substrate-binding protein DctP n=1 Tax=Skermanella mucosa TaxID=1789672 RepID=UPI001E503D78|nr:TRAP transporter substrate-binding protein DctP [Skermanella mucosa]UEM19196.1 TRAP transporter substrate-binding protein DctP [Skermanella mucosa]